MENESVETMFNDVPVDYSPIVYNSDVSANDLDENSDDPVLDHRLSINTIEGRRM